jgi:hypothetical protein
LQVTENYLIGAAPQHRLPLFFAADQSADTNCPAGQGGDDLAGRAARGTDREDSVRFPGHGFSGESG